VPTCVPRLRYAVTIGRPIVGHGRAAPALSVSSARPELAWVAPSDVKDFLQSVALGAGSRSCSGEGGLAARVGSAAEKTAGMPLTALAPQPRFAFGSKQATKHPRLLGCSVQRVTFFAHDLKHVGATEGRAIAWCGQPNVSAGPPLGMCHPWIRMLCTAFLAQEQAKFRAGHDTIVVRENGAEPAEQLLLRDVQSARRSALPKRRVHPAT